MKEIDAKEPLPKKTLVHSHALGKETEAKEPLLTRR